RNLTLNDAGQSTESAPKVYEKLFLSLGQPAVVTPKIFSAGIAGRFNRCVLVLSGNHTITG
ncbi:hypothetical protein, partial [Rhabdochromatium marinum]|uniref:hypothetical protein n=1 Tax=Rhabdochromatium marinum TaxID=48729 RepID=UPI001A9237D6